MANMKRHMDINGIEKKSKNILDKNKKMCYNVLVPIRIRK